MVTEPSNGCLASLFKGKALLKNFFIDAQWSQNLIRKTNRQEAKQFFSHLRSCIEPPLIFDRETSFFWSYERLIVWHFFVTNDSCFNKLENKVLRKKILQLQLLSLKELCRSFMKHK